MLICAEVHDKSKRHKTSIQVTAAVACTPCVSGANADTSRSMTVWIHTSRRITRKSKKDISLTGA